MGRASAICAALVAATAASATAATPAQGDQVRHELRRPQRNGEQWVSRLVARNGVVCVDSQHISVGKHYGGSSCDVLVTPGLFQFWAGNELLKTVARATAGTRATRAVPCILGRM